MFMRKRAGLWTRCERACQREYAPGSREECVVAKLLFIDCLQSVGAILIKSGAAMLVWPLQSTLHLPQTALMHPKADIV